MLSIPDSLAIAIQHHQAGRLDDAETIYREILVQQPNQPNVIHLLGVVAHHRGHPAAAVEAIQRAIALDGTKNAFHNNLGNALQALGRWDEAIACFRRALEIKPDDAPALYNLGNALDAQGKLVEAVACYRQSLQLQPDSLAAHINLGKTFTAQDKLDEAIAHFRRALEIDPDCPEAHNNLGAALDSQGKLAEAVACFRHALRLGPEHAEARVNLGNACKEQGKLDEAIACYRHVLRLGPGDRIAHCNLAYTLNFCPDQDARAIHAEHRRWNRRFAEPLAMSIQPHANERSPGRRLRIGYVSPDFRSHCQALFTLPLFAAHDHGRFEIFCYADVACPDEITLRLRSHVDVWRNTVGMNDECIAALVREDQVDILVDLTMHMANNRLPVFARKPAPVQACWLAYPGTTGLTTIDYRLTDVHLDPPDHDDRRYSEESLRLPETFWCYDPLAFAPSFAGDLAVRPPPALERGQITFGCLNNFCKINSGVWRLWARVLRAVERSRITLRADAGDHRAQALKSFEREGIGPDRLTFVATRPRASYLQLYHDIDIGLDTLPYNGHTTSLDSFWMGAPVITLVGETAVGRAGLCQLVNLGLPELIARSPEQFVRIAADLAGDARRLAELRAGLRDRMQSSPLMDAPRFARNIEAAYREIWRRWCHGAGATAGP